MSSSASTTPVPGGWAYGYDQTEADRIFAQNLSGQQRMVIEMVWHLAQPGVPENEPEREIYISRTAFGNKRVFFDEMPVALTNLRNQGFFRLTQDVLGMTAKNMHLYRNARIKITGEGFWRLGRIFTDPDVDTYACTVLPAFLATATHLADCFPDQYFFLEGPGDTRKRPGKDSALSKFGAPAVVPQFCRDYVGDIAGLVSAWESTIETRFVGQPGYELDVLAVIGSPYLDLTRFAGLVKLLLQACSYMRAMGEEGERRTKWRTLERWIGAATRAAILVPRNVPLMASYIWGETFRVRSEMTLARLREMDEGVVEPSLEYEEWKQSATAAAFEDRDRCADMMNHAYEAWNVFFIDGGQGEEGPYDSGTAEGKHESKKKGKRKGKEVDRRVGR